MIRLNCFFQATDGDQYKDALRHQRSRAHLRNVMTYEEYIAQQQQAIDEQSDDACFLENQPEGQFVRGH